MRGSAKKPPRGIREEAGMSLTPRDSPHWATLDLCAPSSSHPALSPSSSGSFPAWLPPVLIFLSPKSLSCGSPLTSPFRATHSPLSVSPTHPLCPGSALSYPRLSRAPSSLPSSPPWSQHLPQLGLWTPGLGGAAGEGSGPALTTVGQVVGSGSCKESRAGCQGGPSTPCHAELPIPSPTDPPGGSQEPSGLRGSLSVPKQLGEGRCAMRKESMEWTGPSVLPGSEVPPSPPVAPRTGLGALGAL